MARKYTILFMDDTGSHVHETIIAKRTIWVIMVIMLLALSGLGLETYHYTLMAKAVTDRDTLLLSLDRQATEIETQRDQIQAFANQINKLKNSIVALNAFENKIRIIANLEHKSDQASMFAIGGSMPEDLDTNISPAQDHDRLMRKMHTHLERIQQASSLQESNFESLEKLLENKKNLLASTPSLRPTEGWISSGFGYRISPFTGRKEFHRGLDIATKEGSPIIATADGVVTFSANKWLIGNMITIDHGYGMITNYGHIKELLKKKGEKVKRGEVIALVGNTGRSTGPHVHYEVRLNGIPVNPQQYILD
jgi:murein DD-endopeptidase MepM/ murein hydrolase activator NlpD